MFFFCKRIWIQNIASAHCRTGDEYGAFLLSKTRWRSEIQRTGGKNMGYSINSSLNISKPRSSGAVFIWSKRILIGGDLKCSRNKPTPRWISSKWFRYGFLIFFLTMFGNMVFQTYLVGAGASSLREAIKLFWTFRVQWGWTYTAGTVADL